MTPERVARLVAWWVRLYTRSLPAPVARRRVDEIDADLHDHIAHERAAGTGDPRIALGVLSRMVRGLAADASWRSRHAGAPHTAHPSPTDGAMDLHKPLARSTLGILVVAASFLALQVVAMLLTDEVAWGPGDFALAGVLLGGTALLNEGVARTAGTTPYRIAGGIALAAALLLVWTALAVGIIGETGDAADLLYAGVLAVGIAGAVLARFRPAGMARALLATALAQALVAAVALIAGKHEDPMSSVAEIVGVNALFVALFLASAVLFRHAARAGGGLRAAEG
jgi:hypothetical protein